VLYYRIQDNNGKHAIVINYPINSKVHFFRKKENFYLVSARLISYKRIDVIIEAFNWLDGHS